MFFILFDPGFFFFILLFLVLGSIGLFLEIATTLLTILVTIAVLLGLFIYLVYKYGLKGVAAWFIGLAIVMAGLFAMDYISKTPYGKYNTAKTNQFIVLRVVNDFESGDHEFKENEIIVLSSLDAKKNLVSVDVYRENGITGFGKGGTIDSVKNGYVQKGGVEQLTTTNEAVWEEVIRQFKKTEEIIKLSNTEIIELINQASNELDKKKKEGKEEKLQRYYEDIIGKEYSDYDTPNAFFPGDSIDGVKIKIIDETTLKYKSGKFVMIKDDNGYHWESSEISINREYAYQLEVGPFNKVLITIDNGHYQYTFETDSAYNIKRLNVYD